MKKIALFLLTSIVPLSAFEWRDYMPNIVGAGVGFAVTCIGIKRFVNARDMEQRGKQLISTSLLKKTYGFKSEGKVIDKKVSNEAEIIVETTEIIPCFGNEWAQARQQLAIVTQNKAAFESVINNSNDQTIKSKYTEHLQAFEQKIKAIEKVIDKWTRYGTCPYESYKEEYKILKYTYKAPPAEIEQIIPAGIESRNEESAINVTRFAFAKLQYGVLCTERESLEKALNSYSNSISGQRIQELNGHKTQLTQEIKRVQQEIKNYESTSFAKKTGIGLSIAGLGLVGWTLYNGFRK